jgi:hypothetical protein
LKLISRKTGLTFLATVTLALIAVDLFLPRIPQPLSYHLFADQRELLGVPNFWNVISNIPFALAGVSGLVWLAYLRSTEIAQHFVDPRERLPYAVLFVGLVLTAFGSGYYHLHPDNARLVWDRLPMTIVFMSLIAALIMDRMSIRAGLWLLPALLSVGATSVAQWYWSELHGVGDLRFYATVQVYAVIFLLVMMLFTTRYTRGRDLMVVAGFYVLAKLLETFDRQVFLALRGTLSGHTLKHLAAAAAGYWIVRMVQRRRVTAFGLWRERREDGVDYQQRLRREWH